jgi:hypothetical protein
LGLPKDTHDTAIEMQEWGIKMLKTGMLQAVGVATMSINPWLGKAEIDKDPAAFGYTIADTGPDTTRTRFVGHEANWSTDHYSFPQAKQDTDTCNALFNQQTKYQGIDVFNIAFVMSLFNQTLRQYTQNMLTKPLNPQLRDNLYIVVNQTVEKYQQAYVEKLLKS